MAENPTLYKLYDKEYSYNDLLREGDLGLDEYIGRLRRGEKDYLRFRDAYYNLMKGVKDGTVTFENGKYHDSMGRYSNGVYYDEDGNKQTSSKKAKDYYGLMANYIYKTQLGLKEYKLPEDKTKIKWNGNAGIGQAITQHIFNSNTPNYGYYLDLDYDSYNKDTNEIGTKNRTKRFQDALNHIITNYDNIFTGFTDENKLKDLQYLNEALLSLNDGVGNNDYLSLSKAASGLDYARLFRNKYKDEIEEEEEEPQDPLAGNNLDNLNGLTERLKFALWASTNYPITKLDYKTFKITTSGGAGGTGKQYGQWTSNLISNYLAEASDDELLKVFNSLLYNNKFSFNIYLYNKSKNKHNFQISNSTGIDYVLKDMIRRGMWKRHGDSIYYTFPGAKVKSLKFDTKGLHEISPWDNPFKVKDILNEYAGQADDGLGLYYAIYDLITLHKEGGILKFDDGGIFSKLTDYDKNLYTSTYNTSNLVKGDLSQSDLSPWISDTQGRGVGRYKSLSIGDDVKKIEDTDYYQAFTNDLFDENGNLNEVGKAWALATDKLLPKQSLATIFDENGNIRKRWEVKNNDDLNRKPQIFTNVKDYIKHIREDLLLGARHNIFRKEGKRYFYKDALGTVHWVDPNQISGYTVSENPVNQGWENNTYWSDYELTRLKDNPNNKPVPKSDTKPEGGSDTTPWGELQRSNVYKTPWLVSRDLIEVGRLFNSLRTNKNVYDVLRPSLRPALKNTYELYSPVTGAFSEMLLRNRQAADIQYRAETPFTSDASLQLAGQLDANRQADELQYQGFIADDKEIKRTSAEALKRQEDNKARRSDTANVNRELIRQQARQLAELKANKLQSDYTGIDNFMQYLGNRVSTEDERRRQFALQTETSNIDKDYTNAYYNLQEKLSAWRAANPGKDIATSPEYSSYVRAKRSLDQWRSDRYNQAYGGVYGYSYPYSYQSADEIVNKFQIS